EGPAQAAAPGREDGSEGLSELRLNAATGATGGARPARCCPSAGRLTTGPGGCPLMQPTLCTPLIRLSNLFPDPRVYAKCEFLAPSGCFKIHGVTHLLTHLSGSSRTQHLVVPSMGNTALGAAVGARAFGFVMTGVVPETIARAKDEKLRALGVDLVKIAG